MSEPVTIAQGRRGEELAAAETPAVGLRALQRRPVLLLGLVGMVVIVGLAVLAPLVAPSEPLRQDLANSLIPPFWSERGSSAHPLGTDALGRDVASRLVFGARNSLLISLGAVLVGSILGLTTGLVAGFFGRWVDALIMGLGNVQLAFPFILLAIAILGVTPDRTHLHLILVLGIPAWIVYARVVRSRVLAERKKEYVLAARAIGASRPRILLRYVFPSVWQVVPVIALLDFGFIVLLESTLSFLGFGLSPPTPSWGSILAEGRRFMLVSPWLPVLPGLAIMITVLSINLVADGLAAMFDPRLGRATVRRRMFRRADTDLGPADVDGDVSRRSAPSDGDRDGSLLRVRDLSVSFHLPGAVVRAVRGIGFDVRRGEILGIVGESGSGKSVTALSIIRLLGASARVRGRVVFDGIDVTALDERSMAEIRGGRIGMIFQNPSSSLTPVLTIGYQMTEAITRHRRASRREARKLARDTLLAVGIGDPQRVMAQYPFQLSGGMNQRVMIAMALAVEPDLLIADEPTTALDVTTQAQILDQLREIKRRVEASIILITHDIALVSEFADVVMVMYAGEVCEFGPVDAILDAPKHPYTRALLESVPRVDMAPGEVLLAIGGEPPDPADVPPGCPFAPRCPAVMEVCRHVDPALARVDPRHDVACHLWTARETETVVR